MTATFVLLHGFTGAPSSWDAVVARLPPDARVIRPWLLGHGPRAADDHGWDAEVATLLERLAEARAEGAHLVGYSLGGRVGWSLLAAAPSRFSRATLIGAHPGLDADARPARRRGDARWVHRLEEEGIDAFVDAWRALPLWASQRSVAPERRAVQDALRRAHDPRGLARSLRRLGLAEMPTIDPTRLSMPVRLVAGALDAKHRALAAAQVARLPRGALTVVEGAGHNVVLERPDAVARALREAA